MTTPIKRRYRLGTDFPYEGFAQQAIEHHFREWGFIVDTASRVDLLCSHPLTGERRHIEAKGETSQSGLDFRTCLGQTDSAHARGRDALRRRAARRARYRNQVVAVSDFVIDRLGLHWLMVSGKWVCRGRPPYG
jgi:hypothetical protein